MPKTAESVSYWQSAHLSCATCAGKLQGAGSMACSKASRKAGSKAGSKACSMAAMKAGSNSTGWLRFWQAPHGMSRSSRSSSLGLAAKMRGRYGGLENRKWGKMWLMNDMMGVYIVQHNRRHQALCEGVLHGGTCIRTAAACFTATT